MTSIVRPVRRHRRLLLSAPTAALAVTILAGCGGGGDDATDATGAQTAANGQATDNGAGQPTGAPSASQGTNRTFPGASGQIADVTGKTLQVQNTSTQTAVTWTDSTKITNSVSATKADLSVGDCVQIRDTAQESVSGAGGTSDPVAGQPTPAAIVDANAAIEASSVAISDAVDGACTSGIGGLPGLGGSRPQGAPQGMPQGAPQGAPQGMPEGAPSGAGSGTRPDGARGAFGGGANGKVVKIDGDAVTVESTRPAMPSSDGSTSTGEATTTTRTVTLTSGTTYTKTVSATASALKVGSCVTALGTADDAGAISATSIAISPAVNGACTGGMSGRLGGAAPRNDAAAGADNG